MRPSDLPLLLASETFASDDEPQPLDRLRMQKGVFLLEMGGPGLWRLFDFEPYNWGPYSRGLASTVNKLVEDDMLAKVSVPRARYHAYRTTAHGEGAITVDLSSAEEDFIRRVRAFVTSRSFAQLLRDVYAAHPEYATRSLFGG